MLDTCKVLFFFRLSLQYHITLILLIKKRKWMSALDVLIARSLTYCTLKPRITKHIFLLVQSIQDCDSFKCSQRSRDLTKTIGLLFIYN